MSNRKTKNFLKGFSTAFFGVYLSISHSWAVPLSVGKMAPQVNLVHVLEDGSEKSLDVRSRQQGQTFTLVEFSSVFCKGCEGSLPKLAKLYHEQKNVLQVHVIYIDKNKNAITDFIQKHKNDLSFPVGLDVNKDAMKTYGVAKTPTLFLLNKEEKIVYLHEGGLDDNTLKQVVDELKK